MSLVLLLLVLAIAMFVFWAVSLVEVIQTPNGYATGSQLVWLLVLLLGGPIGLILYRLIGRPLTAGRPAGPRKWPQQPPRDGWLR